MATVLVTRSYMDGLVFRNYMVYDQNLLFRIIMIGLGNFRMLLRLLSANACEANFTMCIKSLIWHLHHFIHTPKCQKIKGIRAASTIFIRISWTLELVGQYSVSMTKAFARAYLL